MSPLFTVAMVSVVSARAKAEQAIKAAAVNAAAMRMVIDVPSLLKMSKELMSLLVFILRLSAAIAN